MLDQALENVGEGRSRPYDPRDFVSKIKEIVDNVPDERALLFEGKASTYRQVWDESACVQAMLLEKGVGEGQRVAFLLDPSDRLIAVILGILRAGCAYVPISNKEAVDRQAYIVGDSGAEIVISEKRYAHRLMDLPATAVLIEDLSFDRLAKDPSPVVMTPGSEAYVIYTSGTTGKPKGVRVSHHSMVHFGESISIQYEACASDVVQFFYSPSVDTSIEEICLAFFGCGTLAIATELQRHSPKHLTEVMQRNGVTIAILPLKIAAEMDPAAFPDLRIVIFGGEPVYAEIVNRWQIGHRKVYNGYGPTEATVACTQMLCAGHFDNPPPIGRPMDNHFVVLLDDASQMPVPLGELGEIAVAGPGIALGYLNRDELTRERFIINPYTTDASRSVFYLTGDYGRWNTDGNLEYHGRKDRQVKINGHRVEISEIENALLGHRDVDFAVVTAQGEAQDRHLVAYVKPIDGTDRLDDYWDHMKQILPFQMIPRQVKYLADVPETRSGKVDRERLDAFVVG